MNKDVEQHLQELIEFYSNTDIKDIEYIKKLFVRNLKDVQRRYVKYDKPRKEQLNKAIEYIKEDMYVEPKELYGLVDGEHLLNILQGDE